MAGKCNPERDFSMFATLCRLRLIRARLTWQGKGMASDRIKRMSAQDQTGLYSRSRARHSSPVSTFTNQGNRSLCNPSFMQKCRLSRKLNKTLRCLLPCAGCDSYVQVLLGRASAWLVTGANGCLFRIKQVCTHALEHAIAAPCRRHSPTKETDHCAIPVSCRSAG